MEVLILLTAGAMCIACFTIGAKVGQSVAKGEKIETPSIPSMRFIPKKRDDDKEAETERKRIDTIMRNIERYDGTGRGQEDVPR